HQLRLLALELFGDRALATEAFAEVGAARDHAAVARAGADAEVAALQHDRADAIAAELERSRQSAVAGAYDGDIGLGRRILRQRVVGTPRFPPPRLGLEVAMEDVLAVSHWLKPLAWRLPVQCAKVAHRVVVAPSTDLGSPACAGTTRG